MYSIVRTKAFERDVKQFLKKGGSPERLEAALLALRINEVPPGLRDHSLQGKLRSTRELHVEPDWLLVYEKDGTQLRIICLWLVTHKKLRERERAL